MKRAWFVKKVRFSSLLFSISEAFGMLKLQALFRIFAVVASETLYSDVSSTILESFSVFRERRVKTINIIKLSDLKF